MAYQVEYSFREMKKRNIVKNKKISYFFAAILLLLAVISARFGGATLEVLVWGEQENVRSAATEMVNQLRSGVPLYDAVNIFCDELIYE